MIALFLKNIWDKFQGWIIAVIGFLALIWMTFRRGEKKAEAKAKVEKLEDKVIVTEAIIKSINDDAVVATKIEKEIDALPPSDVAARARKWVRD